MSEKPIQNFGASKSIHNVPKQQELVDPRF